MEENNHCNEEKCEYMWAKKFIAENQPLLHNKLMKSFLLNKEHCFLLNQSIRYSTAEANKALDQAFQDHLAEIRLITQLSNELRRHAIRYDQKLNVYRKRQALILDQPIHEHANNSAALVDRMIDEQAVPVEEAILKTSQSLESYMEDPALYHAIHSLTPRQKQILNASYLFNMTDTEIAAKEGVSQQSISKTRKRALKNLRKQLRTEEGSHD